MTAEEAKTKLEAWRDLLKAKLEGVTKGDWRGSYDGIYAWNERHVGKQVFAVNKKHEPKYQDRQLAAFAGHAIPAMLAGIEVALGGLELSARKHPNKEAQYTCVGISGLAIQIAQAYEPYFQEVQS